MEKRYKDGSYDNEDVFNDYDNFNKVLECVESHRYECSLSADAVHVLESTSHLLVLEYKDRNSNKRNAISELDFRHFNLSRFLAARYMEK